MLPTSQEGQRDMTERDRVEPIIKKALVRALQPWNDLITINEPKARFLGNAMFTELQDGGILKPEVELALFLNRIDQAIARGPWREGSGEEKRPDQWAHIIYSGLEHAPTLLARV